MEEEDFKFAKEFHEDTSLSEDKKIKSEEIDKWLKTAPINLNFLRNLCVRHFWPLTHEVIIFFLVLFDKAISYIYCFYNLFVDYIDNGIRIVFQKI